MNKLTNEYEIVNIKPISINAAYRFKNNNMYMTKEAKEFKKIINEKYKEYEKINGKVKLYVKFYFKDKRKRDVDNYLKLFIDSIKDILINDDSEIENIYAKKYICNEYKIEFKIKRY